MRFVLAFSLIVATLFVAHPASAQQDPQPQPAQTVAPSPRAGSSWLPSFLSGSENQPPQQQVGQTAQAPVVEPYVESAPFPWYPYPPYPNPYYQGISSRNVVLDGVEWVKDLSYNVADRVTDFVDRRLFFNRPATHGSGPTVQTIEPQAADPRMGSQVGPPAPYQAPPPYQAPQGPQVQAPLQYQALPQAQAPAQPQPPYQAAPQAQVQTAPPAERPAAFNPGGGAGDWPRP